MSNVIYGFRSFRLQGTNNLLNLQLHYRIPYVAVSGIGFRVSSWSV